MAPDVATSDASRAMEHVRSIEHQLYTSKFRILSKVQEIHASLAVLDLPSSVNATERRQELTESLAEHAHSLQTIERSIVVATRLREAGISNDLFEAVSEILSALIGCERFAILRPATTGFTCVSSLGVSTDQVRDFSNLVPDTLDLPASSLKQTPALIPLFDNAKIVGVLVLCELLPQRTGLDSSDAELLDMLGRAFGPLLVEFVRQESSAWISN